LLGLGFASALGGLGIPTAEIPVALRFFNVGVEIGQLLFIATLLALALLARRLQLREHRWVPVVAVYGVGSMAAFWFIERTLALAVHAAHAVKAREKLKRTSTKKTCRNSNKLLSVIFLLRIPHPTPSGSLVKFGNKGAQPNRSDQGEKALE